MNKKILLMVILCLCAVFCSSCSDKRPKYKNLAFEFFLHYNPTWEVKEHIESAIVAFLAPKQNDQDFFQETMTITIQDLEKPVPLSAYTNAVTDQIKAIGTVKDVASNIIDSEPMTIGGKPGHKLVYTLTQYGAPPELIERGLAPRVDTEGQTVKMMLAWTIRENRVYLFTYVAQKDGYDLFLKDVDSMIESFRFL